MTSNSEFYHTPEQTSLSPMLSDESISRSAIIGYIAAGRNLAPRKVYIENASRNSNSQYDIKLMGHYHKPSVKLNRDLLREFTILDELDQQLGSTEARPDQTEAIMKMVESMGRAQLFGQLMSEGHTSQHTDLLSPAEKRDNAVVIISTLIDPIDILTYDYTTRITIYHDGAEPQEVQFAYAHTAFDFSRRTSTGCVIEPGEIDAESWGPSEWLKAQDRVLFETTEKFRNINPPNMRYKMEHFYRGEQVSL